MNSKSLPARTFCDSLIPPHIPYSWTNINKKPDLDWWFLKPHDSIKDQENVVIPDIFNLCVFHHCWALLKCSTGARVQGHLKKNHRKWLSSYWVCVVWTYRKKSKTPRQSNRWLESSGLQANLHWKTLWGERSPWGNSLERALRWCVWKFRPAIINDIFGWGSLYVRKIKMTSFFKSKLYWDNKNKEIIYPLFKIKV